MIRFFKSHIEFAISLLVFTLIMTFYLLNCLDSKIMLGLLGTTATLYFGSLKLKIENDKLFKELFTSFNERYDKEFNDLLNKLRIENDVVLNFDQKSLVIDYLNLCAEEYMWVRKNRIPSNVWIAWKAGIKENLKITQVRNLFNEEIGTENGEMSFYGLVKELNIK